MFSFFKQNRQRTLAGRLYKDLVAQARRPEFYQNYGVPDTLDGRFEMIALHVVAVVYCVNHRAGAPGKVPPLAQALFDAMFRDIERNLREMGVGDLSVPRQMKRMMQAFHGRCHAYTAGLDHPGQTAVLHDAIRRNVYGTMKSINDNNIIVVADYFKRMVQDFLGRDFSHLAEQTLDFPPIHLECEGHDKPSSFLAA